MSLALCVFCVVWYRKGKLQSKVFLEKQQMWKCYFWPNQWKEFYWFNKKNIFCTIDLAAVTYSAANQDKI